MKAKVLRNIIASFQIKHASSIEEAVDIFWENFFTELKRLSIFKSLKIAVNVLPIKKKLLDIHLTEVRHFANLYNSVIENINFDWENLLTEYKKPYPIEFDKVFKQKTNLIKTKYNKQMFEISVNIQGLINNLNYLKIYDLSKNEKSRLDKLIKKISIILEMNYDTVLAYLKKGKLPLITI